MKDLKINLHITEHCNYKCKYCFAHFGSSINLPLEKWQQVITNIKSSGMVSTINFAGGEPMLYPKFNQLLTYAKDEGFDISIISNGSLLLNSKLAPPEIFANISTLGISVDSFDDKTLIKLGCCDGNYKVLSKAKLCKILQMAKTVNPDIKIKLNTVVSRLNLHEHLTEIENEISVDRWKFLKVKAFKNKSFSNLDLLISDEEFDCFLKRNKRTSGEIVPEKTTARSYIIIDNKGNLLDNYGEDYEIVGNLLEEKFADIFKRYQFDSDLYNIRYSKTA